MSIERFLNKQRIGSRIMRHLIAYDEGKFEESKHPRAKNGQFTKKGMGESGGGEKKFKENGMPSTNEPNKEQNMRSARRIVKSLRNSTTNTSVSSIIGDKAKVGSVMKEDKNGKYVLMNIGDSYFKIHGLNDDFSIPADPKKVKISHINNANTIEEAKKEFSGASTSAPASAPSEPKKARNSNKSVSKNPSIVNGMKPISEDKFLDVKNKVQKFCKKTKIYNDDDYRIPNLFGKENILMRTGDNSCLLRIDDNFFSIEGFSENEQAKPEKVKLKQITNENELKQARAKMARGEFMTPSGFPSAPMSYINRDIVDYSVNPYNYGEKELQKFREEIINSDDPVKTMKTSKLIDKYIRELNWKEVEPGILEAREKEFPYNTRTFQFWLAKY